MTITVIPFKCGHYRHFKYQNHSVKTIQFNFAPCGHIGNVDVYKIDGVYCLVDEYGKFKIIR